ncbi:hypothetical protein [Streptomyces sp. NPDC023838]|uniref:hypothetical protein n=1 Tax=Streptomyces sp. NPDC023838 TaxID=3154325 RepID=UPI0033E0B6D3
MAENKSQKSFNFGDALSKATLTEEMTTQKTGGRTRTPSDFDSPLTEAWNAKKVLAFELPSAAVEDALKEARSSARYLGFRLEVGQTDKGKGVTALELKPVPKRARKTKAQVEAEKAEAAKAE